jgi:arylsulfatase A-like enzyme
MISQTDLVTEAKTAGLPISHSARRPGLISQVILSVWCGLLAGLLEVGTMVLRKQVFDPDQFYKFSRHFIWLIPVANFGVFVFLGLVGWGVALVWPRSGRWLFTRAMGTLVILPTLLVAFPRIYTLAWLVAALGIATRLVPFVEARSRVFRRFVIVTLPAAVAIVAFLGAALWLGDRRKQVQENSRALPAAGSPNVILIVLDSVAAGHLSLHGYDRVTSPTLVELAGRGIRFEAARAPSSWTLPSHASMFTGRWLHELSVGWLTPLDRAQTTVAEFLGDNGYSTVGMVANTGYCATDSGLARGFTQYQDFSFPRLTALKISVLVNRALEGVRAIVYYSEDWLRSAGLLSWAERVVRALDDDRKGAAEVNRELLDWIAQRSQPQRPFFAFLNYYDAHYPYQLPPGHFHRFGVEATDSHQRLLIRQWGVLDKNTVSPSGVAFAAAAYDDCIADLDEQIGKLFDELGPTGVLDRTWLIVTADHGESFGEHPGIFCHGTSLYDTEVHVPLLVIPPGGSLAGQSVKEAVSLREVAATIVDITGQAAGTPFPGKSLARFWKPAGALPPLQIESLAPTLVEVVPHDPEKRDYWGMTRDLAALGAIKEREWSYIRREGNPRELLFHLSEDANEQRNLADDPSARTTLERMRKTLSRLTEGPMLPERFNP